MLSDLPTEILRNIFTRCEPANITETCHQFASIIYTTRSFWSSTQLRQTHFISDGSKHLRRRLQRAGAEPIKISIGPIHSDTATLTIVDEMCAALSEFTSRIWSLEITAETSLLAGSILGGIFSPLSTSFPRLEVLSIRVETEPTGAYTSTWPHLDVVLERAVELFPMLQTLAITTFDDCIPMFPEQSYFSHLRTLVLDGSLEQGEACIGSIVAVLYNTPRLETLWLKHFSREQITNVMSPVLPGRIKGREIRIPVRLPCLTSLAIAVPGCGMDIVYCIEAPVLRELHLDGSRGPISGETERDAIEWSAWDTSSVQNALKCLALRSQSLCRLAITSVYLTSAGWQWLLFGDDQGPPFPQIQSLALHGLDESSDEILCGFDDALLLRYSREPWIPLRRLVLSRCTLPLTGTAVTQAIKTAITQAVSKRFELEFDPSCPRITNDELNTLENIGTVLRSRRGGEVKEIEWWTHSHQINASDTYAY